MAGNPNQLPHVSRLHWSRPDARRSLRLQHFVLLGRLAAGASHEIRNPLSAVFLYVEVLEEELRRPSPDSAAQIADSLTEIKTNLARLEELVQDYLSLVRVSTMQRTPAHLGTLVTTFAQEMHDALAARGITLQRAGLTPLGVVPLHWNSFRRALLNLVHNAMDAMPQGGHTDAGRPGHSDADAAPGGRYGARGPCRAAGADL